MRYDHQSTTAFGWCKEDIVIDLQGRIALVTGGSRGIGAATCRLLARCGADVAVHFGSSQQEADGVARDVEVLGRRSLLLQADLRSATQSSGLVPKLGEAWGRLDILVNNAGVWTHGRLDELDDDIWRDTMRINLDAVHRITRAALPLLRRSEHAAIVNVASTAAQRGEAEHAHYAASKAALVGYTKSLAVELGEAIRVNAVAPGWVRTEMVERALDDPEDLRTVLREIPRGRIGEPDEVAGPIAFLASDLAAHITGEVLNVNGGSVRCG
jgi:3-oxoacyl-[acyl-carrier protein] reductase